MSESRQKIVVTGLAAGYPFGGVFWDYIQYLVGFAELGHDVLYIEDTGRWCYSPVRHTFVESGADNARVLDEALRALGKDYADRWHFLDSTGAAFGRSREDTLRFCRDADLFLNISAACVMRDEYRRASIVGFIDSDPLYTQAAFPRHERGEATDDERRRVDDIIEQHDVFFSFGENTGADGCAVPTGPVRWIPTRQPICLGCFEPHRTESRNRRTAITTVASWEPHENGPVIDGVAYHGKSVEFERFIGLPARIDRPMELALSGEVPEARLVAHGWSVRPAYDVSHDPWVYRSYLADSFAEWSVAKHAYVASNSGWFSCRSACYLALGVPVIVQDTGFTRHVPSGRGLFAFRSADDVCAAIESIQSDYTTHRDAAIQIASEYFDAGKVLADLLSHAGATA